MGLSSELKHLNSRLSEIDAELKIENDRQRDISRRVNELQSKRQSIRQQIARLSDNGIVISEHAYLRYMERVLGMDLQALAKEIIPESAVTLINNFRSGKIACKGHTLVVENGVVRTVITKDGQKH